MRLEVKNKFQEDYSSNKISERNKIAIQNEYFKHTT